VNGGNEATIRALSHGVTLKSRPEMKETPFTMPVDSPTARLLTLTYYGHCAVL
jgi:hypothetical protein